MPGMLDINICIDSMHRQPPQVLARFQRASRGEVVMSAISYAELCHGALAALVHDRRRNALDRLTASHAA